MVICSDMLQQTKYIPSISMSYCCTFVGATTDGAWDGGIVFGCLHWKISAASSREFKAERLNARSGHIYCKRWLRDLTITDKTNQSVEFVWWMAQCLLSCLYDRLRQRVISRWTVELVPGFLLCALRLLDRCCRVFRFKIVTVV
jgi:hypothetical protein